MKDKYPMKSGPFLGLVIDYENLIYQQAHDNIGPNKMENTNIWKPNQIEYKMGKSKTKVNTRRINTNRRGVKHD